MRKYLVILFLLIAFPLFAADIHVCDTAVCGQTPGDGSTWSVALDDLPTSLVRGNTYWIADGTYNAHRFNDTESGETYITIKKATASAHGSNTGWDDAYGNGQAAFSPVINFTRKYYIWDGVVGSGLDKATYGFIITQPCPPVATAPLLGIPSIGYSSAQVSHVTISHTALISCGGEPCNQYEQNPIYSYVAAGNFTEYITISNNYMYNGSTLLLAARARHWIIENNVFDTNWSGNVGTPECAGVDGKNGQMYASNVSSDWIVRGNIFKDGRTFINGAHWYATGDTNIRHQIYNNIIIGGTYAAGFSTATASTTDWVKQWDVHHNTFIGVNFTVTTARGVVFAGTMSDVATDHNHAYNNLFYNCTNPRMNPVGYTEGQLVHDYNAFMSCTVGEGAGEVPDEAHDQTDATATSPFTDSGNGDYTISTTWDAAQVSAGKASLIGKGKTDLGSPYDIDMAGNSRDATPDIGAYESGASADETDPILAEVTPVSTPSPNQAPHYVFSSNEAGTVTYGGDCGNGSLSTAVVGNNTVEWNLGIGTYSNCTITVTDAASNASTPLAVTEFVITPTDSSAVKTIEGGVVFQGLP